MRNTYENVDEPAPSNANPRHEKKLFFSFSPCGNAIAAAPSVGKKKIGFATVPCASTALPLSKIRVPAASDPASTITSVPAANESVSPVGIVTSPVR